MAEKYNEVALHFDKLHIPPILRKFLQPGPFSLADIGCGDGPWFDILIQKGFISPQEPVYAVDLEADRIMRAQQRFPWITAVSSPADDIRQIAAGSLDWVISTMVMEHVPDEERYLKEITRLLKPDGKAYISTVFKRKWAWYFRKRDGESVLDTSHLREYTDLDAFRDTIMLQGGFGILAFEIKPMWFPLLDPILFRVGKCLQIHKDVLKLLRLAKVPILGYFELHTILGKNGS